MRIKFIICFIIFVLALPIIIWGQKTKPRPNPTPTNKKAALTPKQRDELLSKVNASIVAAGEIFKQGTPESYTKSIKDFESAINLIDMANGQLGVNGKVLKAISLFSIGTAYSQLGDAEKAINALEKSLPIYLEVEVGYKFEQLTFQLLGKNYQKKNEHQKAVEYFSKSITEYRKYIEKQDKPESIREAKIELANILMMETDSLTMIGANTETLKASEEAYSLFTEANLLFGKANALNRIGKAKLEMGFAHDSFNFFRQALEFLHSPEASGLDVEQVKQTEAVSLNNMANAFNVIGDKNSAFEYYKKALEISDSINFEDLKPMILNNVGIYQRDTGNYTEAIENFIKSSEISERIGDQRTLSISLNNIGACFVDLGNLNKASEFWKKAIDISVKINDVETTANIMSNSAAALLELGETEKALELIQLSIKYYEISKNKQFQAAVLTVLSRIQKKKGETVKALESAEKGFRIASEIGDKKLLSLGALFIGSLYVEQNQIEKASQNYLAALRFSQENGDSTVEGSALLGLSILATYQKNTPLAILYGKKSVNQFQSLRANIKSLDKETQSMFLENVKQAYQHLADLLISAGRIAEAEQVLGLLKEEELYEYVRRDDKVANELKSKLALTEEEALAFKRYGEFAERIALISNEYTKLEAEKKQLAPNQPFPEQTRFDELEKQLKDANQVFLKFLDQLKVEFGEDNSRVAQVDSGLQAMLKEMKVPATVIISTIASSERLNLILTTDTIQKAYTVDITSAELNKLVAEFRRAVQNPNADPRPAGQKIYDVLVKPLAKDLADLQVKTVVWSLDGTLRYVPMAALWDGNKYLAEDYANAVITLASRDKLKDIPSDKSSWEALGFGVSKAAEVEEIESGAPVKREFDSLPSVPEELCRIVSDNQSATKCAEKGIIKGHRFLDEKFTLLEFKNQLGRFSVVHIASHFSLKAGNDQNSYLLLGGGDERRLTIAELNRSNSMFVGVELLTLSACNTAMTGEKKANGVEIEGFGAIAQKQGAKSVMATLWSVADPSTRDLMSEFYTFLSLNKLSKAEALRQAQVKLIYGKYNADEFAKRRSDLAGQISSDTNQIPYQKDENRPFAHPFYWSSFVLIGNWQ